jgi:hypothetical protein
MQAIDLGEVKVEGLAEDWAGFGDNGLRFDYFRGHPLVLNFLPKFPTPWFVRRRLT